MQTFLPYEEFSDSVRTLDRQRLGKQRVEVLQIMQAITGIRHIREADGGNGVELERYTPKGWTNHPVAIMWRGHLDWLLEYQYETVSAWMELKNARGLNYTDTCLSKTERVFHRAIAVGEIEPVSKKPTWIGDLEFHRSHQSNLIRKDRAHYAPQFPNVDPTLPYIWPRCECSVH